MPGTWWRRLKSGLLAVLFLLVPFAGAFHPRLKRRRPPDGQEIGEKK